MLLPREKSKITISLKKQIQNRRQTYDLALKRGQIPRVMLPYMPFWSQCPVLPPRALVMSGPSCWYRPCNSCYHLRPWEWQGSELSPGVKFVPKGHAATGTIPIWLTYAATWNDGSTQVWGPSKDHVLVCGPTADGFFVDVCDLCGNLRPQG